ncbi:COBRA-like protein 4 [Linum perenne]
MDSSRVSVLLVCGFMFFLISSHDSVEAYDMLDPNGNITIKWDVMSWTPDGYVAVVTMTNFQMYRHITSPGWRLGWTWSKKEVIWSMVGAQATEQGDCSKFRSTIPHCCSKNPTVVDLLPGVPYNQQISNCCKGGVVSSYGQDPSAAVSSFQVSVGRSGTTNKTVKLPRNFTLMGPGLGYTCSQAKVVPRTVFMSSDGRRKTQSMMTWNVTCTYSQMLASQYPKCCVSMSTFYNSTITPCPSCACGCSKNRNNCVKSNDSKISSVVGGANKHRLSSMNSPLLECTQHMCPIRVHWHVKLNYKQYWRVKISITNFNYMMNYSRWTLVVQHPNLNNLTEAFSFGYKPLHPYKSSNDSGMFYGLKFFNDFLNEAGPEGNVQSELLLEKDVDTFTFKQGWAFPRKVYFNGDECMMPSPEDYPFLPNSSPPRNKFDYVVAILPLLAAALALNHHHRLLLIL